MKKPLRAELKFLISHEEKVALLERWKRHLVKDRFMKHDSGTPILSLYYDTPDLAFYHEKLDGVPFRNKVRLRTYGTRFQPGQATFIEIKQRHGDYIRKFRQKIENYCDCHLNPKHWSFDTAETQCAFGVLTERHRLLPCVQVWYQREVYESVVEPGVRVSFDSCLTAIHPHQRLTTDHIFDPRTRMMPETRVVLEVKSNNGTPRWAEEGARLVELVQIPVPKYVMAVEKLGIDKVPLGETL
ncbi:MAG: polyphosphate polymerase domain-containing protein [Bryobacterales bacterium]